jgi:exodeoxyribonuclease VII large subunit
LAVLARGYAIARKLPDGAVVRDAASLAPGDRLQLRFGKGSAEAAVEQVEEEPHVGTEI